MESIFETCKHHLPPNRKDRLHPGQTGNLVLILALLMLFLAACSSQQRLVRERKPPPLATSQEVAASWQPEFPFRDSFEAPPLTNLIRKAFRQSLQNPAEGITPPHTGLTLAANVARHWLNAAEARQQLELTRRAVDAYLESIKRIREGYRTGIYTIQDLKQAKSVLIDGKRLLTLWRERQEKEQQTLRSLLGYGPGHPLEIPEKLPESIHPIPPDVPALLLTRRPDLSAAGKSLQTTNSELWKAVKKWLMQIYLTDDSGGCSDQLLRLTRREELIPDFAKSVATPPTDGLTRNEVGHFMEALLQAFRETKKILNEARRLAAQERTLNRTIKKTVMQHRQLRKQRRPIRLLEKQRQLFNARSTLLQVHNQRLKNRIDLHLAVGGSLRPSMSSHASKLSNE